MLLIGKQIKIVTKNQRGRLLKKTIIAENSIFHIFLFQASSAKNKLCLVYTIILFYSSKRGQGFILHSLIPFQIIY